MWWWVVTGMWWGSGHEFEYRLPIWACGTMAISLSCTHSHMFLANPAIYRITIMSDATPAPIVAILWTPDRLKSWRVDRGWTQIQAATWAGCTQSAWSDWERGASPISPLLVNRLNDLAVV